MDLNSIEFYLIAFMVAIALIAILFRQKQTRPARSHIATLPLKATGRDVHERDDNKPAPPATLKLKADANGSVTITRTDIPLRDQETVNLIVTIIDDKITIEEKKGMVAPLGGKEFYYDAEQTVDFIPAGKVYIRYESAVVGRWAKFAFLNREGNTVEHQLGI